MKKWLYERGCFFNDGEKKFFLRKKEKRWRFFINKYLQSRKLFGNASISSLALPQPRRIWQLERQGRWFETMWEHRDDHDYQTYWKADFRMSGESFQKLVRLFSPALIKRDTQFHWAIAVKKRVAIAIWRLATGNSFRSIAKAFAVGISTAVTICKEFCGELKRRSSEYIRFPATRRENAEAILKFKADVNYTCVF